MKVCGFFQAVTKMIQEAYSYVEKTPNMDVKLKLIDTLRTVTAGKVWSVCLHVCLWCMCVCTHVCLWHVCDVCMCIYKCGVCVLVCMFGGWVWLGCSMSRCVYVCVCMHVCD